MSNEQELLINNNEEIKNIVESEDENEKQIKHKNESKDEDKSKIELLSKRQRKRLAKKLKWESLKHEKRLKERARKKQRMIEAKSCNIKLGPSRKELKHSKMISSKCKTSIVIDLSFDELMSNKVSTYLLSNLI